MGDSLAARLVQAVLRCYPARWRRRHGDEAAELAALLLADGTPAASIACSYLAGAARAWVTPRPGRRLSAVACSLLAAACLLGGSAGLLASTGPARAASSHQASPRPSHPHQRPHSPATRARARSHCRPALPEAGHDRSC